MTFSLYPEDDAPTASQLEPSKRRRALIWAGGAAAAIVALAAAGWLVFGNNGPGQDRGNGSVVMPAPPEDDNRSTATLDPSASLSAPASASRPATPSRGTSAGAPTGGPGTPAPGLPVSYRVGSDLCPSIDLGPVASLAGPTPSAGPVSDRSDNTESGYTDYTCKQLYTSGGWTYVQAEIFGNAATAANQLAIERANAPKPQDDVSDVGSAAYGFLTPGTGSESYTLWAQDGNLYFGINIRVKSDSLPSADTLRAAAVKVLKTSMPKLRG